MFTRKEIKKKIAVVLALTMVLAIAAPLAAYAGEEDELILSGGSETTTPSAIKIDYSEPADLAEALLDEYTKNFTQCDSSSNSDTVKAIHAALNDTDKYEAKNGGKWDATFKSWTIVGGSPKYVLLSKDNPEDVELDKYVSAVRVKGADVEEGYIKWELPDGKGYNIMKPDSFFRAPANADLEMSADCRDLEFLNVFLNDATKRAKAYFPPETDGYGNGTGLYKADAIAANIDSPTALSALRPGFHYFRLVWAIEDLCQNDEKYKALGLTIDYDKVAWSLGLNGAKNKVEKMYFAVIDNKKVNDYGAYDYTVWIEVWKYEGGNLTKGYAPLVQNALNDGIVDLTDTAKIDTTKFTESASNAYTVTYKENLPVMPEGVTADAKEMPKDSKGLGGNDYSLSKLTKGKTPELDTDDGGPTYEFEGWSLKADGTKADVVDKIEVIKNVEVYAIWTRTYEIRYNANVPEGVSVDDMPESDTGSGEYTLSTKEPKRPADTSNTYSFGGWSLTSTGSTAETSVVITDAPVDVYAIWTATAKVPDPVVTPPGDEEPVVTPPGDEEPVVTPPGDVEPVVTPPGDKEPVVTPLEEDDDSDDTDGSTIPVVNEETSEIIDEDVPLSQLPEEVIATAPQEITEIAPEEVPLAGVSVVGLSIAGEEVPLGGVPQTGDNNYTVAWYLLALLSALGLALLVITDRKGERTK